MISWKFENIYIFNSKDKTVTIEEKFRVYFLTIKRSLSVEVW